MSLKTQTRASLVRRWYKKRGRPKAWSLLSTSPWIVNPPQVSDFNFTCQSPLKTQTRASLVRIFDKEKGGGRKHKVCSRPPPDYYFRIINEWLTNFNFACQSPLKTQTRASLVRHWNKKRGKQKATSECEPPSQALKPPRTNILGCSFSGLKAKLEGTQFTLVCSPLPPLKIFFDYSWLV